MSKVSQEWWNEAGDSTKAEYGSYGLSEMKQIALDMQSKALKERDFRERSACGAVANVIERYVDIADNDPEAAWRARENARLEYAALGGKCVPTPVPQAHAPEWTLQHAWEVLNTAYARAWAVVVAATNEQLLQTPLILITSVRENDKDQHVMNTLVQLSRASNTACLIHGMAHDVYNASIRVGEDLDSGLAGDRQRSVENGIVAFIRRIEDLVRKLSSAAAGNQLVAAFERPFMLLKEMEEQKDAQKPVLNEEFVISADPGERKQDGREEIPMDQEELIDYTEEELADQGVAESVVGEDGMIDDGLVDYGDEGIAQAGQEAKVDDEDWFSTRLGDGEAMDCDDELCTRREDEAEEPQEEQQHRNVPFSMPYRPR